MQLRSLALVTNLVVLAAVGPLMLQAARPMAATIAATMARTLRIIGISKPFTWMDWLIHNLMPSSTNKAVEDHEV